MATWIKSLLSWLSEWTIHLSETFWPFEYTLSPELEPHWISKTAKIISEVLVSQGINSSVYNSLIGFNGSIPREKSTQKSSTSSIDCVLGQGFDWIIKIIRFTKIW